MPGKSSELSRLLDPTQVGFKAANEAMHARVVVNELPVAVEPPKTLSALRTCLDAVASCMTSVPHLIFDNIGFRDQAARNWAYHVLNVARIFATALVLLQRAGHQWILSAREYGSMPAFLAPTPAQVMDPWIGGMPLFAASLILAMGAEILNIRQQLPGERAQSNESKVFALLSGSSIFILADLLRDTVVRSLYLFVAFALVGFVALGALSCKLVFPDVSNQLIINHLRKTSIAYPNVSVFERVLNGTGGFGYAMSAISLLMWAVLREVNEQTIPLDTMQKAILGAVGAVSFGFGAYTATDKPQLFQLFVMLSKFVRDLAIAAEAYSGLMFYVVSDPSKTESGDANSRGYILGWFAFSLAVAAFSALNTEFRFIENHDSNRDLEEKARGFGKRLAACWSDRNPDRDRSQSLGSDGLLLPVPQGDAVVANSPA